MYYVLETGLRSEMADIAANNIDYALLRRFMGPVLGRPEEAVQAAAGIKVGFYIPIHITL